MSLYSELNDIGLIPPHEWPYPNAELHLKLSSLEEELTSLSDEDRQEIYHSAYDEGFQNGKGEATDDDILAVTRRIRAALGMDGSLDELLARCRELAKESKPA